ncbi:Hsp70 family protein [Gordonia alkanivorans]|uniref:Hsp70 family protein n=1 Tax=Gordonia alkanivorans TaxID=84096 RepID=UPI000FDF3567|nr:Hsp70 family protein [Gordonia alkanivorans]AZZ83912.1 molecular chaperone DnaK [Gordonia alkanivorans]MDH3008984.1 Hsp70 family protein [Gordonia alkanivorans]MDH3010945.1 Hsp70 family protein [Gordonia alkanivorans]MDH3017376.1 Hsp70 family protein [Gordonia alkanivorans]MDH3026928.1 Hsp70 family protein [Gordonia alkanivorans]
MTQESRRRLCIDFGTSNTAAAYRVGPAEPVIVPLGSGGPAMPSAVFADDGGIVVGHDAVRRRVQAPDAYEDSPKSRIDEGEIELGDRFWPIEDLIGAVLRHAHQTALRHSGLPEFDSIILTHPDKWSERRKGVLRRAAERAGISADRLRIASESLAAAWYYVYRGHDVTGDERMCVFDFGAGTCDVAVLIRAGADGFTVTGSGGDNNLGGRDLDARMTRWVLEEAAEIDPGLPARLRAPAAAIALADHVRSAKEALSDTAQAVIELPGTRHTLLLTRREFESMIAPFVERAVELTRDAIARADAAGTGPKGPVIVYVTGGTSSIPMLQSALSSVGRVARIGDPKVVVAQGGLLRSTNVDVHGAAAAQQYAARPTDPPMSATAVDASARRIAFPTVPPGTVITGVLARNGQVVRAGEPLATLDSPSGRLTVDAPVAGTLHGLDLRPGVVAQPGVVFGAVGAADLRPEQWSQLHRAPAGITAAQPAYAQPQPMYPPPQQRQPQSPYPPRQPGTPAAGHAGAHPVPASPGINTYALAGLILGILGFPICLGTIVGMALTVIGINRAEGGRDALLMTALGVNILGTIAWVVFLIWIFVTG